MTHQNYPVHGKSSQSTDTEETFKALSHEESIQTDDHSEHHHHINVEKSSGARLLITLVLNLIIPIIQIIAGIFAHNAILEDFPNLPWLLYKCEDRVPFQNLHLLVNNRNLVLRGQVIILQFHMLLTFQIK